MTCDFFLESRIMARVLILVFCLAISAAAGSSLESVGGRIAGGEEVDIKDYPYQASILTNGFHICGAAIITSTFVLTAADCLGGQINTYTVRVGSSIRGSGGSEHQVENWYIYPEYNMTVDYDLAMIRINNSKPFEFGERVDKIAMPIQGQETEEGAEATVTGWGAAGPDGIVTSMVLQGIKVPVVTEQHCTDAYGEGVVTDRIICAGHFDGDADACQGDTGGPMVVDGLLVGITSRRRQCAQTGVPGLYTKVSSMRDWIKSITGA